MSKLHIQARKQLLEEFANNIKDDLNRGQDAIELYRKLYIEYALGDVEVRQMINENIMLELDLQKKNAELLERYREDYRRLNDEEKKCCKEVTG